MAGTYTQIHIQFVFAVKYRDNVINADWKNDLYSYISAIIQNNDHKVLIINGMPDHIHILIGMRPTQSISELMRLVKANSSKWINDNKLCKTKFEWQEGYAAFSYTKSDVPQVISYIQNQEKHHQTTSFREEYLHILKNLEIDYDERFIFQDLM